MVGLHSEAPTAAGCMRAFVLFVVVATGNHFLFDAAAGATVAALAYVLALRHRARRCTSSVSRARESLSAVRRRNATAGTLERMRATSERSFG
jgi:hypothetical protein